MGISFQSNGSYQKASPNRDTAISEYHELLKSKSIVAKKQKTTGGGFIAFDAQGNELYEYRKNSMGSYYVRQSADGGFTYVDINKKTGKPDNIEHYNAKGERQYTRSLANKLNVKW